MTRRLLLSYLTITAFVLLILEVPLGITFANAERDRLTADVERDARVVGTLVEDVLEGTSDRDVQTLVERYEARTGGRVVVVDDAGVSIADSENPDAPTRDFSTRPEFRRALAGREATGTRRSETLRERFVYVAVPVASGGEVHGAVRITLPTSRVDSRIRRNWLALGALAAVVLAAVAAVGAVLARSVTRPLRSLDSATRDLARGDLHTRAPEDAGPPEVRELAHQFNVMAARLEELVDAQKQFVADASHELRTPLTAMRLRLENLEAASPEDVEPEVAAAAEEIARISRLVDGLLTLARAEGQRPALQEVDLDAIARERAEAWAALAEENAVRIEVSASGPVPVFAAPGATEQIVDNLLSNALDVSPTGSTLRVIVERRDARVELHVIDDGPGLPDDQRQRALDRFWRAPDAPSGTGSGLGLAIVAQLAASGGGSARLDEAPTGGIDAVVEFAPAPPPGV